jgi:hypothetical protein
MSQQWVPAESAVRPERSKGDVSASEASSRAAIGPGSISNGPNEALTDLIGE